MTKMNSGFTSLRMYVEGNMQHGDLPHHLFITCSEDERTTTVAWLADRLKQGGLIPRSLTNPYLDYVYHYVPALDNEGYVRFLQALNTHCNFHFPYYGLVAIDITSFAGAFDSHEFLTFLAFIKRVQPAMHFVFFLNNECAHKANHVFNRLSRALPLIGFDLNSQSLALAS